MPRRRLPNRTPFVAALVLIAGAGCHGVQSARSQYECCKPPAFDCREIPDVPVPKELNKVSLPPYVVETPDVLQIDALRVVPLPPYRLEPPDVLELSAENDFERARIAGRYPVEADGTINLGQTYGGPVRVAGLTPDEAQKVVEARVRQFVKTATVTVKLAQPRAGRQISGRHTVRPDGTVNLGPNYGSVYVAGLTLPQVKQALEEHLSNYLYKPEVAVDVFASRSKFYYVITDFAGSEQVVRLPHTGNETVLDAVSLAGGLSAVSGKQVWVARPAPAGCGDDQILPVDWCGIARRGQVKTNYQIMAGDRVYVLSQAPTQFDACMARVLAPIQRALGATLLGAGAATPAEESGSGYFAP